MGAEGRGPSHWVRRFAEPLLQFIVYSLSGVTFVNNTLKKKKKAFYRKFMKKMLLIRNQLALFLTGHFNFKNLYHRLI